MWMSANLTGQYLFTFTSGLVITHQFLRKIAVNQELQDVWLSLKANLVTNGNYPLFKKQLLAALQIGLTSFMRLNP